MTASDILNICIIPIGAFLLLLYQLPSLFKDPSFKNVSYILIGLFIMGFSINDGINKYDKQNEDGKQIKALSDSLRSVKDTLISIGLSIDNKTGKLLVMDSQLLKKKFQQIINNISSQSKDSNSISMRIEALAKEIAIEQANRQKGIIKTPSLKIRGLQLSQDLLNFAQSRQYLQGRFDNVSKWGSTEESQNASQDTLIKFMTQTENLYKIKFASRTEAIRNEFEQNGLINSDLDNRIIEPINLYGIDSISRDIDVLAKKLP